MRIIFFRKAEPAEIWEIKDLQVLVGELVSRAKTLLTLVDKNYIEKSAEIFSEVSDEVRRASVFIKSVANEIIGNVKKIKEEIAEEDYESAKADVSNILVLLHDAFEYNNSLWKYLRDEDPPKRVWGEVSNIIIELEEVAQAIIQRLKEHREEMKTPKETKESLKA